MAEPPGVVLGGLGDEAAPDLEGQVRAHRRLGWSAIELRTIDGIGIADLPDDRFAAVVDGLARAGLAAVAVSSRIGGWGRSTGTPPAVDLAELEALAPRLHALGAPYVRVMSFANDGLSPEAWRAAAVERLALLARRAGELGVTLLHENCAGWAGQGPAETLDLLEEVDDPALRLVFDTGNGLAYGYEAADFLRAVLPWVVHVHVKDARPSAAGPEYVPPGRGVCGVGECLRLLVAAGYRGTWVLEPHLQVAPHADEYHAGDDGVDAFVACGRELEGLIAEEVLAPVGVGTGAEGARS